MAFIKSLVALLLLRSYLCIEEEISCNKKPLNARTDPLPPDNRFALEILGVDDTYIPNREYIVRLSAKDDPPSFFIAFTIYAKGELVPQELNPRKTRELQSGRLVSETYSVAKDGCDNIVVEIDVQPKTEATAKWYAPSKGNRCVTISAFVAVKPDVWYSSEGPLTKQVCEDHRNDEDMKPAEKNNCQVCEEARYELKFQGLWSVNTHPRTFPESEKAAKAASFSDIVGASHDDNFILFRDNFEASKGLQMLAEQGNTTKLEQEVLEKLGRTVRTVIKATGPPKPSMSTVTSFRTSRRHHFISLATAIIPSPDWFLGVYNMELCDDKNWAQRVVLNLYPMDAGTDSGTGFDSPNEETLPPKVIGRAVFSDVPNDEIRPFAKLFITLVRTYANPNCINVTYIPAPGSDDEGGGEDGGSEVYMPAPVEPTTRPPPVLDPESWECPVTAWEDWQDCEGPCENNRITGYRMRSRYFVVNGVEVGKDFDDDEADDGKNLSQVPEKCLQDVNTEEIQKCEEECAETEDNPEPEARRGLNQPRPGDHWHNK